MFEFAVSAAALVWGVVAIMKVVDMSVFRTQRNKILENEETEMRLNHEIEVLKAEVADETKFKKYKNEVEAKQVELLGVQENAEKMCALRDDEITRLNAVIKNDREEFSEIVTNLTDKNVVNAKELITTMGSVKTPVAGKVDVLPVGVTNRD